MNDWPFASVSLRGKEVMESQITFNQVKAQTLSDTGSTPSPKYPGYVGLKAEYDPEVSKICPASCVQIFANFGSTVILGYDCAVL